MKVLYDHQAFDQKFGGMSRYFYELLCYFRLHQSIDWELAVKYARNAYLKNDKILNLSISPIPDLYRSFLTKRDFPGKGRLYNIYRTLSAPVDYKRENQQLAVDKLKTQRFDIIHPTYFNNYFLENLGNTKLVLTVYDMIHEIFPETLSLRDNTAIQKRRLLERADRIIAISRNTRNDLINIYNIDPARIKVIHLSSSFANLLSVSSDIEAPSYPYILFTGLRRGYKNFYIFLYAVEPILRNNPELKLLCVGSSFREDELRLFDNLGVNKQLVRLAANDAQLACLYANARLFVFPSLYEGFGIPILEAFSCGTPCALSNTSSLPEVGGDAALYFDPKDHQSIFSAIGRILQEENLRIDLISKGKKQLTKFSIKKTVDATLDLYSTMSTVPHQPHVDSLA